MNDDESSKLLKAIKQVSQELEDRLDQKLSAQINGLSDELKEATAELHGEIKEATAELQGEISALRHDTESMNQKLFHEIKEIELVAATKADKSDIDRIFNVLDQIRGVLDIDDVERAALISQVNHHEASLNHHDMRLQRLEKRTA